MKITVYGQTINKGFYQSIIDFFEKLKKNKIEIYVFKTLYEFLLNELKFKPEIAGTFSENDEIDNDVDFMFSIGGDGTFLETIHYVKKNNIPVVGINSGRLGFLADISSEEISNAIDMILSKQYSIEERVLLELHTENNLFGRYNYALNELTVHRKDTASMITINAYFNNEYLNTYWADGLIISTPTGSTAYSLSVGGPIVIPNSQNFIITPISPHNLTVRPIVVPDDNEITLKVESRVKNYLVTLDFRSRIIEPSVELTIRKANFTVKVLKLNNQNYFKTLRNKLMWGADKRN
ncbi:MAG: NAD kinase [Bacteroidetes bacterium]|jgi:NAD+ kinase|nr:NAD kinase [Bacteroidota bacterium]MBT6685774.1 NAD kinase [Bacteroidota bacterium]MBT7141759.1 NAD kinase [Bacteroidota bacterium]MBT7490954.1 NAD kinase [Bacteroidota bacterium]